MAVLLDYGKPVVINYPGWMARFMERWGYGLAVRSGDPLANPLGHGRKLIIIR